MAISTHFDIFIEKFIPYIVVEGNSEAIPFFKAYLQHQETGVGNHATIVDTLIFGDPATIRDGITRFDTTYTPTTGNAGLATHTNTETAWTIIENMRATYLAESMQETVDYIIRLTYDEESKPNKNFSMFVDEMVPDFIVDDNPAFVGFIKSYFDFLQLENNPIEIINDLTHDIDIDKSINRFESHYRSTYAVNIPQRNRADMKIVVKNIRDFYVQKGNEDSFAFLVRTIFDEPIEFYYPKVDILRCSDGKWFKPTHMAIQNVDGSWPTYEELVQILSKSILALDSGETGFVHGFVHMEDPTIVPTSTPTMIWGLEIVDNGLSFVPGELIRVRDNPDGIKFKIAIPLDANVVDSIVEQPGEFLNNDGFLSSDKYIQDNLYYQEHSYQVKTPMSSDFYWKTLQNNVHPSGTIFFGVVDFLDGILTAVGSSVSTVTDRTRFIYNTIENIQCGALTSAKLGLDSYQWERLIQGMDITTGTIAGDKYEHAQHFITSVIEAHPSSVMVNSEPEEFVFVMNTAMNVGTLLQKLITDSEEFCAKWEQFVVEGDSLTATDLEYSLNWATNLISQISGRISGVDDYAFLTFTDVNSGGQLTQHHGIVIASIENVASTNLVIQHTHDDLGYVANTLINEGGSLNTVTRNFWYNGPISNVNSTITNAVHNESINTITHKLESAYTYAWVDANKSSKPWWLWEVGSFDSIPIQDFVLKADQKFPLQPTIPIVIV